LTQHHDVPSFSAFGLMESILDDVADMGFETPTPIQARCIPVAMTGADVMGMAQTGTGKTAAFGLPTIQRVAGNPNLSALVLSPTRELARQIADALYNMGRSSDIRVVLLVGGVPVKEDRKAMRCRPNIVVATPGRLADHLRSNAIDLSHVEVLTVDEADRMHDMGFLPQIKEIIDALPQDRQTMMFSATMPAEVEKLVRRSMRSPARIEVSPPRPAARVEQQLFTVQEGDKMPLLLDLLARSGGRVLVFARTRRKVERLARSVAARDHDVARLHGDRAQSQRDAAVAGFRSGKYRVLIATDIAARGLDVADIEHVINYDFPACAEDYLHRIGRTARAAASGTATSFVTRDDRPCLDDVEKMISARLPVTPARSLTPAAEAPRRDAAPVPRQGHAADRDSQHTTGARAKRHAQPRGRQRRSGASPCAPRGRKRRHW